MTRKKFTFRPRSVPSPGGGLFLSHNGLTVCQLRWCGASVAQNLVALRHFTVRDRRGHLTCTRGAKQQESGGPSHNTKKLNSAFPFILRMGGIFAEHTGSKSWSVSSENSFEHRCCSESSSGYCEGFSVDQSTTRIVNLRSSRAAEGIQG